MNDEKIKEKIAEKVKNMPKSGIRKFFDLVIGMENVISLGVGEPDFVTPWNIREAIVYSLEKGYTMYTSNKGLEELREEISRSIEKDYGIYYNPEDEIIVTVGVSEALDLATRAIINPNEKVIVIDPSYVAYKPCVELAHGKALVYSTNIENGFKVDVDELEKIVDENTKAMIINYPNNPTGVTYTKKELEEIADFAVEHDLIIISDEVYDKLTYDSKHVPIASLNGIRDRVIYLNGFSKAYAMTGLRIGYACANKHIAEAMLKIHQYTMLCAPITSQFAAIEALKNGKNAVKEMKEEYRRRRNYVYRRLREIGFEVVKPQGAFYVYPRIGINGEKFAEELLKKKRVAVVPGNAFGSSYRDFIRISFASSIKELKEAFDRIEEFINEIKIEKTI